MMFTMKKICILFLLIISINCLIVCADGKDNDEHFIFLDLSRNNSFYNDLRKYFDKIELRYIQGEIYSNGYGMEYFILKKLSYYGIKNNEKYLLGYVTINGIYDKDSNLLMKVEVPEYTINIGLSSTTLNAPWTPRYALKSKQNNVIGNTDPFAYINIDFSNNSLRIYEPDY